MEEVVKALGPWPLIQGMALGMIVAAIGFWAMWRGTQESRRRARTSDEAQTIRIDLTDEELRMRWDAHKHLDHIHENSFAMVKHLEKLVELNLTVIAALNRVADSRWNKGQ
jgi:ABC-type nickel/cobalt efflux system permease component RcnA